MFFVSVSNMLVKFPAPQDMSVVRPLCVTSEAGGGPRRPDLAVAGGVLARQPEVQHVHLATVHGVAAYAEVALKNNNNNDIMGVQDTFSGSSRETQTARYH